MKYSTCFWQFLIRFVELKDLHLCRSTRVGLSTAVADKLKAQPAQLTCHFFKKAVNTYQAKMYTCHGRNIQVLMQSMCQDTDDQGIYHDPNSPQLSPDFLPIAFGIGITALFFIIIGACLCAPRYKKYKRAAHYQEI